MAGTNEELADPDAVSGYYNSDVAHTWTALNNYKLSPETYEKIQIIFFSSI